ncbi:MAG: phosphate ABC transporter substrate-binding protein PstS [Gallionellales bacterium 35-53-114]|jgi:phosphate transport system substrate-binding protein|nr:MAG: phosphate ABC transporter substrate-binding protein PstS [Gallionellales bacterium 35-53-114]OYZ62975.1 MAG: phosphate ABC transporter substrate-binding protein PstS [Gallionellales bacterium 24-53-125]OZB09043.1 MAG: phosphate ABC transporter substrate-binding protein PstS [Gallionellales bacterium 39-52-133]HQS59272.1 phosphate ABC transporter substrate-binding protein PstS [Gallionellaceae bacterium]HQS76185.1 phosphate ABC transporter substrate-binding protein PstS [Gallionellaceae 
MDFSFGRCLSILCMLSASPSLFANSIHGAGATFPALLYQKWAVSYTLHKGINVEYLAVGSGEGIKRIDAGSVDFGGSDMPLTLDELNQKGLIQFPMVMGAITPVINLPGVHIAQLKLDGETLAAIFMGKIRRWNDPALLRLNPKLRLPKMPISVIYREDKSGTTFNFTNYLSKVSGDWQNSLGEGLSVNWPVGRAAKGNAGVAARVKETEGSIGYVDYAHAMEKNLDYVQLKNHDGYYVVPNAASTEAAAAGARWDTENGFYQILTNAPGVASWPIAATTFILLRKEVTDFEQTRRILKLIDWNYRTGELQAMYLDFVMLPKQVAVQVRASWKNVKDKSGRSVWN